MNVIFTAKTKYLGSTFDMHNANIAWLSTNISKQTQELDGDDALCVHSPKITPMVEKYQRLVDPKNDKWIFFGTTNRGEGWEAVIVHFNYLGAFQRNDAAYSQCYYLVEDDMMAVQFKLQQL
jgi:hypothetical protein